MLLSTPAAQSVAGKLNMLTDKTKVRPLTLQSLLSLTVKICSYLNKQNAKNL